MTSEPLRVVVAAPGEAMFAAPRLSIDEVMALLETVGRHLEGRQGGSRFPELGVLQAAVAGEEGECGWPTEYLAALVQEIDTIEREGEALPATVVPLFAFGDEGYAEVYSRDSPKAHGTVRSHFQALLDHLRTLALEAQSTGRDLVIERRGPAVHWWD